MKNIFSGLLLVNFVFEGLVGILLIFGISAGDEDLLQVNSAWAQDYGFAALAIASIVFWVWKSRFIEAVATPTLGFLMCFHTGLAISTGIASSATADPIGASIAHGVLAITCITLFFTRKQWCEQELK